SFRAKLASWDPARLLDTIVPLGRMIYGRRDALADLVSRDIPALVMTGTDDYPRPVHEGRRMAHALGCDFVALPGAGHMSTLPAPDLVTTQLLTLLEDAFDDEDEVSASPPPRMNEPVTFVAVSP